MLTGAVTFKEDVREGFSVIASVAVGLLLAVRYTVQYV